MSHAVKVIVIVAAGLFVCGSASMNALFIASFGRTPVETGVLVTVSVAADAIKVVLPVLLLRALALRLWGQACGAGLLLAVVTAMSLVSGVGFAALTRGQWTTAREAASAARTTHAADLKILEDRLAGLMPSRSMAHIDNDLAAAMLNPQWRTSNGCAQNSDARAATILSRTARLFCADVSNLRNERATAMERTSLLAERQTLRNELSKLAGAPADADPQGHALAQMIGVAPHVPRMMLTVATALMLELGAMILVVLAAGPTVKGWVDPRDVPTPAVPPAELPKSVDRLHWQRRQQRSINGDVAR